MAIFKRKNGADPISMIERESRADRGDRDRFRNGVPLMPPRPKTIPHDGRLIRAAKRRAGSEKAAELRDAILRRMVDTMDRSEQKRAEMMASSTDSVWPPAFLRRRR